MGKYICSNPGCMFVSHESPTCPFPYEPLSRPVRRPITEAERRTMRHLRQLERDGVLEMPNPGLIPRSWLWAVPLGLVVFIVLVILI
jgi:hypothetical protein